MDYILESVPFTNCDDEPRLHDIIQGLIESGEVPEYKDFTQESGKKKQRRKRKVSEQLPELINTLYEVDLFWICFVFVKYYIKNFDFEPWFN